MEREYRGFLITVNWVSYMGDRIGLHLTAFGKNGHKLLDTDDNDGGQVLAELADLVAHRVDTYWENTTKETDNGRELAIAINDVKAEMGPFHTPLDKSLMDLTWNQWQIEQAKRIATAVKRIEYSWKT